MKRKSTVENIDEVLESWKVLPIKAAKLQTHFEMAQELSAISQCIKLGILDDKGNPTERTAELCRQFRERSD